MALTRPRAAQIYDIDYKQATRAVTVSNITLSGGAPSLVDGVTLSANDRVLVTGQDTASQNGVYFVSVVGTGSSGTWLRTTDTNSTGELLAGTIIMVTEGVTYHDTQWKLTTDDPIVIGVTELTFVQNYSANSISAGTSNVSVTSNANVTISSNGTPNVLTVSNTGAYVEGLVSATGNITGNYIIGNGSQLTGLPAGYANSDVANYLASGNDTSNIITTGNVSGNYILGNGSFLTGVITSVSNISNGTSNVTIASANGNVTVGVGGTSNIATFATTGVYVTGEISANGNITAGGVRNTTATTPPSTPAVGDTWYDSSTDTMFRYVYDGNNYFWQDISGGSIASNVQSYGNSNVASFLSSFGSNTISTTGNITVSYVLGNGSQLTGLPAGYGNANLANIGANAISTTGNISAGYLLGNGSQITGLPAGYANSDVASYLASGNVVTDIKTTANMSAAGASVAGNLSASALSVSGTGYVGAGMSIVGNLTVSGNINYQNVTDLVVGDPLIYIGANNTSDIVDLGIVAAANVSGIYQHLGFVRNHTTGVWGLFGNVVAEPTTVVDWGNAVYQPLLSGAISSTGNISAAGNVTGNYVLGNGSLLTGIAGGPVWANVQTGNFTAGVGNAYPVNTTSSAITVTLPSSPGAGNVIILTDYKQTFGANPVTLVPNGSKIYGNTANIILNNSGESVNLVYIDSTQGWIAYSGFVTAPVGSYSVSYLVVAGGGGTGYSTTNSSSGGGGAGGLITSTVTVLPGTPYSITVGAGGSGAGSAGPGNSGSNSTFGSIATALGGGGGGYGVAGTSQANGLSGGSGGGSLQSGAAGSGTPGQGYPGAQGNINAPNWGGGGGGGAGGAGTAGSPTNGGPGGPGTTSSISGTSVAYAGGGGGAGQGSGGIGGTGGTGGGGPGISNSGTGTFGTTNTGGGGGGGAASTPASSGGSGIVIISYAGSQRATGGTITSSGGNTIHTFTSSGTFTA